jgi:hypothetical protein
MIYAEAAKYLAFAREGAADGIYYINSDLHISLVFRELNQLLYFQNSVHESGAESDSITTLGRSAVTDLKRVFASDYHHLSTDGSPACTGFSVSSPTEVVSVITPANELRMIESPSIPTFKNQKFEKCHLIPRKKRKLQNNDDNILLMSREMHENFDGINMKCMKTPTVAIEPISVDGQRVKVKVIFHDEGSLFLAERLKAGSVRLNDFEYETELHFQNGATGFECLRQKFAETSRLWTASDLRFGIEDISGDVDDNVFDDDVNDTEG